MTSESFAREVFGELTARNAAMPYEAIGQLVGDLYPDGPAISPKEAVEWWLKIRLATLMSDVQWRVATDPEQMLIRVRFHGFTKELTLFGCECCRRIWDLLPDERFRRAVEVLEKYLQQRIEKSVLESAYVDAYTAYTPLAKACDEAWYAGGREDPGFHARELAIKRSAAAAVVDMDEHGYHAALSASNSAARARAGAIEGAAWNSERLAQAMLLREMIGNPLADGEPA